MTDNAIPEPKLKVGDLVYVSRTKETDTLPTCPDCHGSKRWQVTTPAGSTFEVNCYRCGDKYVDRDILPRIERKLVEPVVEAVPITSIEIRVGAFPSHEKPIEYRARTSGGGHFTFTEETVVTDEAVARAAAQARADEQNAKHGSAAEAIRSGSYLNLTIEHALHKAVRSALFDGFWSYRRFREEIEGCVLGDEEQRASDTYPDAETACDHIRQELEYDKKHRKHETAHALEAILIQARAELPPEAFADLPAEFVASLDAALAKKSEEVAP